MPRPTTMRSTSADLREPPTPDPMAQIHDQLAAAKRERRTLSPSQAPEVKEAIRAGALDLDADLCISQPGGGLLSFRPRDVLRSEQGPDGQLSTFHLRTSPPLAELMPHYSAADWKLSHRITHHVAFGDLAAAINDLMASGASFDTRRDPELFAEARRRVETSNRALVIVTDGTTAAIVDAAATHTPQLASLIADLATP